MDALCAFWVCGFKTFAMRFRLEGCEHIKERRVAAGLVVQW